MVRRHALTDDQRELIEDLFGEAAETGRRRVDRRQVIDGIFWILRGSKGGGRAGLFDEL